MERRGDKARKGLGATGGTLRAVWMCGDWSEVASEASLFSLHVAAQAFQSRVAIQAR